MTKISKKQAYPIKKPVLRDYFVGTDSENLKTVTYDFESVAALVASINGDSVISYTYSNNPNLGITEQDSGYFLSFNDETSFPLIAKLFVSNRSRSNALMTNLFGFIKDNASNFSLKLRNAANPNNIAYLNIDSVENHGTYYTFNISVYKVNYIGELENGAVYIFDFVIKNDDLVLLLPEFNKITFDAGFSLIGQNLNINANCQWIITNNAYSNVAPVVLNIPLAATGLQRIDHIVATTSNTFMRVPGVESVAPVAPVFTEGTIIIAFSVVTDAGVVELVFLNDISGKLDKGNYVGTAETLKTDIETRVVKVAGSSLVPDAEITKLSHLDDTADIDKPVSTAQQAAIDAAIEAQITDSIALSDPTVAIPVEITGNAHILGVGPGTYPNWGGMVIPENNIGTLRRVAGVYSVSLTAIDANDAKIKPFVNQAYAIDSQVSSLGKFWYNNAVTAIGEIPGASTKWVELLSGYFPKSSPLPLDKTDFFLKSENMYNKNAPRTTGFYLQNNGVPNANATSSYTDFIPVTAGDSLKITGITYVIGDFVGIFYDANYVKLTTGFLVTTQTFTVPANAVYFRFNDSLAQASPSFSTIMLAKSTVSTYVDYKVYINPASLLPTTLPENSVTTALLQNGSVTPQKSTMFIINNIFDKATMVTSGKLVQGGNGAEVVVAEWSFISVPIDVSLGTSIAVNKGSSNVSTTDDEIHFFNNVGERIGGSSALIATIPVGAVLMKMNISTTLAALTSAKDSFIVAYSATTPSVYYPYKYILNPIYISDLVDFKSNIAGKKVRFVGDSITLATGQVGMIGYVSRIATNTGIIATNKGDNGATISNYPGASCFSGNLLKYQFDAATNLVTFFGATNDFANNVALGTNTDGVNLIDTTVKGSLYMAIKWVKDNHPLCKILVMTPLERSTNNNNSLGLKLLDYRNAIVEICDLMAVPYLDLHHNNLISVPTAYKYLYDGLHPNNAGYEVFSKIIEDRIIQILSS